MALCFLPGRLIRVFSSSVYSIFFFVRRRQCWIAVVRACGTIYIVSRLGRSVGRSVDRGAQAPEHVFQQRHVDLLAGIKRVIAVRSGRNNHDLPTLSTTIADRLLTVRQKKSVVRPKPREKIIITRTHL